MSATEPTPASQPEYRGLPMRSERILGDFREHANDFLTTYAQFRDNFPNRGSAVLTMAHRDLEQLKLIHHHAVDALGDIPELEELLHQAIDLVNNNSTSVSSSLGGTALYETGDRDA